MLPSEKKKAHVSNSLTQHVTAQTRTRDRIDIPDILAVRGRPQRRLHRAPVSVHFAVGVTSLALGPRQQRATAGGQRRVPGGGRGGAGLAAEGVEVLKVALGHLGDVLAAEDADLEVLRGARRQLGAAGLEVREVLVDDLLGADVPGNVEAVAFVGDELAGGGEVDTAGGMLSAGGQIRREGGREGERERETEETRQANHQCEWERGRAKLTRCEDA